PLHPIPRSRDDDADRGRAFPGIEEGAARRGARSLLQPARCARPQEEAVDVRASRLAEAAARRGHSAGSAEERRQEVADSAAARRAAEERAGRAPVRARRLHGARRAITACQRARVARDIRDRATRTASAGICLRPVLRQWSTPIITLLALMTVCADLPTA